MTLCLNMIVRDEITVLPRLFASVAPHITDAAIVDTGSTDGTQAWLRSHPTIPLFVEHPWVNFSHNRNQALQLAKSTGATHALIIDADEELVGTMPVLLPGVSYRLNKHYGNLRYSVPAIIDLGVDWIWREPVHEYLECLTPDARWEEITTAHILVHTDGARSQQDNETKFLADAELLYPHRKEPRACFYLAQSYRDAGKINKALNYYQERAQMQGWDEETWCAQYRIGQMHELMGANPTNDYLRAYNLRPTRAEPLHALAAYYRQQKMWALAYLFASKWASIRYPTDKLFVEQDVYVWRMADELAVSAYWTGRKTECKSLCEMLLEYDDIPPADRERIQKNLEFCL